MYFESFADSFLSYGAYKLQSRLCYFNFLIARTMQVKVLFMMLMDLCRRTAGLQHPLPVSQVGSNNIQVRLHYIDGNYSVQPEVVEASLGPHMQVTLRFSVSFKFLIFCYIGFG